MLIPTTLAIAAAVQCVVSPGGSVEVNSTTRLTMAPGSGRDARGSGLVAQKSTHAFVHEPLLPAPDAGLALARPPHDLSGAKTIAGQQDDPSPPDVLLRAAPVRNNRLKTSTLGGTNVHMDTVSHSKRLAHRASHGNRLLELIH